jgi:hypothetical protein
MATYVPEVCSMATFTAYDAIRQPIRDRGRFE